MDTPNTCSVCRQPLARDWLAMPDGAITHHACGTDMLLEWPDRMKSLDAWERITGKRLGSKAAMRGSQLASVCAS